MAIHCRSKLGFCVSEGLVWKEKAKSDVSRHPRGLGSSILAVALLAYRADAQHSEVMLQEQAEALGHMFLRNPLRGNAM